MPIPLSPKQMGNRSNNNNNKNTFLYKIYSYANMKRYFYMHTTFMYTYSLDILPICEHTDPIHTSSFHRQSECIHLHIKSESPSKQSVVFFLFHFYSFNECQSWVSRMRNSKLRRRNVEIKSHMHTHIQFNRIDRID